MNADPFLKIYNIVTPDGDTIKLSALNKRQVKQFIIDYKLKKAAENFQLNDGFDLYSDADNNIFIAVGGDDSGYFFSSQVFFKRYKSGSSYFETLLYLSGDTIYSSFRLKPDQVKYFLKEARWISDYKEFDGYKTFELKGGPMLFCRKRVNDLYDAYWYPTREDFDYSYRSFAY